MDFTITLTTPEQRYAEAEVARLQASGEPDLTLAAYVQRRVSKVFASEIARTHGERRTQNVAVLQQFVDTLPANPVEANAQLEKIGLQVDETGKIVAVSKP